jgi:hypothetical protein
VKGRGGKIGFQTGPSLLKDSPFVYSIAYSPLGTETAGTHPTSLNNQNP